MTFQNSIIFYVRNNPDGTVSALTKSKRNPIMTFQSEADMLADERKLDHRYYRREVDDFVRKWITVSLSRYFPNKTNIRVKFGNRKYTTMDDFIDEFGLSMWELLWAIGPTQGQAADFIAELRRQRNSDAPQP